MEKMLGAGIDKSDSECTSPVEEAYEDSAEIAVDDILDMAAGNIVDMAAEGIGVEDTACIVGSDPLSSMPVDTAG
jgi:hypothetical protein